MLSLGQMSHERLGRYGDNHVLTYVHVFFWVYQNEQIKIPQISKLELNLGNIPYMDIKLIQYVQICITNHTKLANFGNVHLVSQKNPKMVFAFFQLFKQYQNNVYMKYERYILIL